METAGLVSLVTVLGGLAAVGASGAPQLGNLVAQAKQGADELLGPPPGRRPMFQTVALPPLETPTPPPTVALPPITTGPDSSIAPIDQITLPAPATPAVVPIDPLIDPYLTTSEKINKQITRSRIGNVAEEYNRNKWSVVLTKLGFTVLSGNVFPLQPPPERTLPACAIVERELTEGERTSRIVSSERKNQINEELDGWQVSVDECFRLMDIFVSDEPAEQYVKLIKDKLTEPERQRRQITKARLDELAKLDAQNMINVIKDKLTASGFTILETTPSSPPIKTQMDTQREEQSNACLKEEDIPKITSEEIEEWMKRPELNVEDQTYEMTNWVDAAEFAPPLPAPPTATTAPPTATVSVPSLVTPTGAPISTTQRQKQPFWRRMTLRAPRLSDKAEKDAAKKLIDLGIENNVESFVQYIQGKPSSDQLDALTLVTTVYPNDADLFFDAGMENRKLAVEFDRASEKLKQKIRTVVKTARDARPPVQSTNPLFVRTPAPPTATPAPPTAAPPPLPPTVTPEAARGFASLAATKISADRLNAALTSVPTAATSSAAAASAAPPSLPPSSIPWVNQAMGIQTPTAATSSAAAASAAAPEELLTLDLSDKDTLKDVLVGILGEDPQSNPEGTFQRWLDSPEGRSKTPEYVKGLLGYMVAAYPESADKIVEDSGIPVDETDIAIQDAVRAAREGRSCQAPLDIPRVLLFEETERIIIPPDGWCFYRAVLTALGQPADTENVEAFARQIATWLDANKVQFEGGFNDQYALNDAVQTIDGMEVQPNQRIVNGSVVNKDMIRVNGTSKHMDFDEFIDTLPQPATSGLGPAMWAELENTGVGQAVADLTQSRLAIYQQFGELTHYTLRETKECSFGDPPNTRILYLFNDNGNHFDVLVPQEQPRLRADSVITQASESASVGPAVSEIGSEPKSVAESQSSLGPSVSEVGSVGTSELPIQQTTPRIMRIIEQGKQKRKEEVRSFNTLIQGERIQEQRLDQTRETIAGRLSFADESGKRVPVRNLVNFNTWIKQHVSEIRSELTPAEREFMFDFVVKALKDVLMEDGVSSYTAANPEIIYQEALRKITPPPQIVGTVKQKRNVDLSGGMRKNTFRRRRGVTTKKHVRRTSYRKNRANRPNSHTRRRS
jgi:hypothetical protein